MNQKDMNELLELCISEKILKSFLKKDIQKPKSLISRKRMMKSKKELPF